MHCLLRQGTFILTMNQLHNNMIQVLEAYSQDPLSFVQKVLDDPIYLEDITGLSALKAESENVLDDWTAEEDDF